ncbi:MAG: HAMP domain-containing sensor histidine kinase [bacterium]
MKNNTKLNKLFYVFVMSIFITINLHSQVPDAGKTIVTQISVNNYNIDPLGLSTSKIKSGDLLVIRFDAELREVTFSPVVYKVLLNGVLLNNDQSISEKKSVELTNLSAGKYILKIQGSISNGKELSPALLEFSINGGITKSEIEKKETESGTINIIYILYAVIGLLFIGILFLLFRKKPGTRDFDNKVNAGDKKIPNVINGEFKYAYEQLKKEYKILQDENGFQRSQIRELREKITDLEQANVKLIEKKDKLIESKRQLEEIQNQKEELFAIAIHDIKNPASAIKNYIELIQSYDFNAVEQSEIMESMIRSSEQIVELAHEMTTVMAQTKPEPMLTLENGSLKKIIDMVCTQNKPYAAKKEVNLVNKSSMDLPNTKLDPAKMEEVLDNLINNAIKYAPKNSFVNVSTFFTGAKITVEIVDNGVGLSEDDIKRAFQKGGKLGPQPTAGEKSSGLGLWIVKKIIEEHNGRVWVKSKLGSGSTFGFEIPIVKDN